VRDDLAKLTGTAIVWRGLELVGVKIIFLLRMLILARLLSPDDFGLLAIAMTAIGFLLSITDFGMIPALVQQPKLDSEHYHAAWTVIVARATTIAGLVFLSAPFIAGIFDEPRAAAILQVLAIRPLIEASASIRMADLMRNLRFRSLAVAKLSEGLLNTIVAIVLARHFGVWALVFGALAGATGYMALSYILAPHRPHLLLDFKTAKPLIRFGRWIFLRGLIIVVGGILLNIVISRKLGAAQLGLYFLAARLAFLPSEVASKVVGNVAFPLFSRIQSDTLQIAKTFRAMFTVIWAFILPFGLLLIILAPSLVQEVLGPRWEGSAPVIRIIAVVSIVSIVGEIITPLLKAVGQPYKVVISAGIQTTCLIAFVWVLTENYGINGAALAWLPAMMASQIIILAFIHQILPKPFNGLAIPVIVISGTSAMGACTAFIMGQFVPGLTGFVLAISTALLTTGAGMWIADSRFELGLKDSLGRIFPQIVPLSNFSTTDR
jgi:O-antigen/teichoic acid export membrane protein